MLAVKFLPPFIIALLVVMKFKFNDKSLPKNSNRNKLLLKRLLEESGLEVPAELSLESNKEKLN